MKSGDFHKALAYGEIGLGAALLHEGLAAGLDAGAGGTQHLVGTVRGSRNLQEVPSSVRHEMSPSLGRHGRRRLPLTGHGGDEDGDGHRRLDRAPRRGVGEGGRLLQRDAAGGVRLRVD